MDTSRFKAIVSSLGTGATRRGALVASAGALAAFGSARFGLQTAHGTRPLPGTKEKKRQRPKKKRCTRLPLGAYCLDHSDCCSGLCARFNVCGRQGEEGVRSTPLVPVAGRRGR